MRTPDIFRSSRRTVLAGLLAVVGGPKPVTAPLLVDDFHDGGRGGDYTRAFNAAFRAGRDRHLHLSCRAGGRYAVQGSLNILPDSTGWTPDLDLNGATIVLGSESAGFRRRGIKDGEAVNASSGGIRNGTIDANHITGGNGVRCIFGSNSGGTSDAVKIINMAGGYGWLRHCYVDGGEPVGRPVFTGEVSGRLDGGEPLKWYACGDSSDLTVALPGDLVAPGQTVALASPKSGPVESTGCAPLGVTAYWTNTSANPVQVPDGSDARRVAAGLVTQRISHKRVNGTVMSTVQAEYVESGGHRRATGAVRAVGALFRQVQTRGGYYGVVVIGQDGVRLEDVSVQDCVRGVVGQFGATRLTAERIRVSGSVSSAVLLGYGSSGCELNDIQIDAGSRWSGEALVNVTLGSGDANIRNVRTITPPEVLHGQYHVYLGPGCGRSRFSHLSLNGDCIKAFIAVESAWRTVPSEPECFSGGPAYSGISSTDLTDVEISDVFISVPSETQSTATALALIQNNDDVNGEIGLSNIIVLRFQAPSSKHAHSLRLIENARSTLKGIRRVTLRNVDWQNNLISVPRPEMLVTPTL